MNFPNWSELVQMGWNVSITGYPNVFAELEYYVDWIQDNRNEALIAFELEIIVVRF